MQISVFFFFSLRYINLLGGFLAITILLKLLEPLFNKSLGDNLFGKMTAHCLLLFTFSKFVYTQCKQRVVHTISTRSE